MINRYEHGLIRWSIGSLLLAVAIYLDMTETAGLIVAHVAGIWIASGVIEISIQRQRAWDERKQA